LACEWGLNGRGGFGGRAGEASVGEVDASAAGAGAADTGVGSRLLSSGDAGSCWSVIEEAGALQMCALL
jgi:hypothetical protein